MAITDRNLSVGTELSARFKGTTYTAEFVETEGARLYRLSDGREFKSPSAAGTAITGKACNGWAFWSVGDGSDAKQPAKSKEDDSGSTITPAPKPGARRRGRKAQETRDDAPPATEPDDQPMTMPRVWRRSPASPPRPRTTTRRTASRRATSPPRRSRPRHGSSLQSGAASLVRRWSGPDTS
jgi:hypothetical protein